MALTPLNAEQVRKLLAEGAATPSPEDLMQILRYLAHGQSDLEGKARQLKSTVSRLGK